MLILGLILIGIGIAGVVSLIVITIAEWKFRKRNEEDIYKKLDEWVKHHKEVHFEPTIHKPVRFKFQKLYSKDFILNCPSELLRKIVKADFGEALMERLEEYLVVTNDYNERGDQRVSIDIWVSKEDNYL